MFEEICIVCGKDVPHQMTIYCSRDCQNANSPPSVPSSACSSPGSFPDYTVDMPSLSMRHTRGRASISSSSASSWSLATDELDDYDSAHIRSDHEQDDFQRLSYTRKPSRTTNQSIVPILLSRSNSDTSSDETQSITKPKHRLPTSLSAYFASLTISPPKKPVTTISSAHTVSPSTPKLPLRSFRIPTLSSSASFKGQPAAPALTPPITCERGRGRRRRIGNNDASDSPSHTRTRRSSPSRSHSRSRSSSSQYGAVGPFNWQLSARYGDERRGRARAEDLDGLGSTEFAPGYGRGRSGLLHRSKDRGAGVNGFRY